MFSLTHQERKILLLIAILIMVGSVLRFFNILDSFKKPELIISGIRVKNRVININLANEQELQAIPGIGPTTAQRIIEYRSDYGSFRDLEDLEKVKGIGSKKSQKIKEHITFE